MSRIFRGIVMSVATLMPAAAQDLAPAGTALVEGSVVDKISGNAVKRAHVMCVKIGSPRGEDSPENYADTDLNGHYALHLEPGAYRLWVERTGFARQNYRASSPNGTGDSLTLTAGQELRDVSFRIVPFGAISGHVLDEDGDPVQGAGIQVLKFSYASGKRTLLPVSGTSSNDRGEYRTYGLPSARYLLLVTQRGGPLAKAVQPGMLIADVQELYAPLFYPGVLAPSEATQIALTEGRDMQEIDFRLKRIPGVTLRGRLQSPAESFMSDQVRVILAPREGANGLSVNCTTGTVDRSNGRFEFHGVAPGSYLLVASQLHRGRPLSAKLPVEVVDTGHQSEISVSLAPAFDLTGDVRWEGGSPDALKGARVTLTESESLTGEPQPSGPIAPDGTVRLAGVSAGFWEVGISPMPKGAWIKSIAFGGHEAPSPAIELTTAQAGTLQIVLAAKGGTVRGTVVDGGRPHRGTVVIVPASSELRMFSSLYATSLAAEDGRFSLSGIRPGSYKLFAFDEVEPFAWLDPDFMRAVESTGAEITISEADEIERQLTIIPADLLQVSN